MRRWALLLVSTCACAPYESRVLRTNMRWDHSRPVVVQAETRRHSAEVASELSNDVLALQAAIPVSCRRVFLKPVSADTTSEGTLTGAGRATQYGLLGSAAVLGVVGAGVLSASCEGGCDRDEAELQRNTGVGLMALGGAALGLLVFNAARVQPRHTKGTPIEDYRSEGAWEPCRALPVGGEALTLELADGRRFSTTTNATGDAALDLSAIPPSAAVADRPFALLRLRGARVGVVDLGGTALHRASADAKHAHDACHSRCEDALLQCRAAFEGRGMAVESASWLCRNAERECRDGCAGKRATPQQIEFVLRELKAVGDELAKLRPPLDSRKALSLESLLLRARALRPYTPGMAELLNDDQRRVASQLLVRLHTTLSKIGPLLEKWASGKRRVELLESLSVFRVGL